MECKRIPSARINCDALTSFINNPCTISEEPLVVSSGPTQPFEEPKGRWISEVLLSGISRAHIEKFRARVCRYEYGNHELWKITFWSSKTSFLFSRHSYPIIGTGKHGADCFYIGKMGIVYWSNMDPFLKSPWGYQPRFANAWLLQKPQLWRNDEYLTYWNNVRTAKGIRYVEENGDIRYWPAEGGIGIIKPETQRLYEEYRYAFMELNEIYRL